MRKFELKLTGVSPHGLPLALAVAGLVLTGDMPLPQGLASGVHPTVAAEEPAATWDASPAADPQSCEPLRLRGGPPPREPGALAGAARLFAVTATGYSSSVEECDDTPHITASNRGVRWGVVALSRDLLREFTPGAPFGYGDRVFIPGVGEFMVEDTMSWRFRSRVDIWFPSREAAANWGVKRVNLVPA